jgi:hypothetical protein
VATTEYFTHIEDAFVRLRGKHRLLSPQEWALIEGWRDRGIPLDVVLRGMAKAFESPRAGKSVNSLRYCERAVEAEFQACIQNG